MNIDSQIQFNEIFFNVSPRNVTWMGFVSSVTFLVWHLVINRCNAIIVCLTRLFTLKTYSPNVYFIQIFPGMEYIHTLFIT